VETARKHALRSLNDSRAWQPLVIVLCGLCHQIRSSLLAIAEEQGLDGHRSCLTKFSELLLLNGVISTQQMGVALDLVEALFEPGADWAPLWTCNESTACLHAALHHLVAVQVISPFPLEPMVSISSTQQNVVPLCSK
jgi:hypothetical protein